MFAGERSNKFRKNLQHNIKFCLFDLFSKLDSDSITKSLKEVREKYTGLDIDVATGDIESLTGRIIFKRDTGKLCFAEF
ncbi:MAG: hypothetical protein DSY94_05065 [SAR324 cluster bacterium]|uniref:Uncharacterized protein n=1 Tax=SAR324 cluster bacterium TaxID=2024889 RepID=A0A432GM18_9DELT|nr:MAG: hypothetical protein DSY94_05065 [SAR324 cluster bacterium]